MQNQAKPITNNLIAGTAHGHLASGVYFERKLSIANATGYPLHLRVD
jgi:hypothetical protein